MIQKTIQKTIAQEIKKLMAEAKANFAIAMDEELDEDVQDIAYEIYYDRCKVIADRLVKMTNGKIDFRTAQIMTHHKMPQIEVLIARYVG